MKCTITILMLICSLVANGQSRSISFNSNNGKTKMVVKQDDGPNFSLEYEGEITLNDDDSDIVDISGGGYVELKKSGFGSRRRVYIEKEGGELVRKYYVGSKETPFNPEGKMWLAEILLEVVRTTTIGAEKRVARLYKSGGVARVLEEIKTMDSEHVQAHYLRLLRGYDLNEKELGQVLEVIGSIDSDHHRAELLTRNIHEFLKSNGNASAFMNTVGDIDSDHHKAEILTRAIQAREIDDSALEGLFRITEDINSDHHKAEVLTRLIKSRSLDSRNSSLLFKTLEEVDSDHHLTEILRTLMREEGYNNTSNQLLIQSLKEVDSDHHKASLLRDLVSRKLESEDQEQVLSLMRNHLDSDHHSSDVLRVFIDRQEINEGNVDELVSTVRSTSSSHHKGDVYRSLSSKRLSDEVLEKVLQSLTHMDSDHALSEVLRSYAAQVRGSSAEVKKAYRDAAESISSSFMREDALKAIQ